MNISFFPGWANRKPYKARSVAAFCQASPGILPNIEPLPCTTSSCENGRMKFSVKAYNRENVRC